jgi:pimeloyl-ACP methyl ester carboxylesterase
MIKTSLKILLVPILAYIALLIYMYFVQESIVFHPKKIDKEFDFGYEYPYEELFFPVDEDVELHGIITKKDTSDGLIFYLHGNAGNSTVFNSLVESYPQYDIFVFDYRSYGKSGGELECEEQFYRDAQIVYESIRARFDEEKIIIIGFSVGTAAAAYLAEKNNPRMLILQAPYYSMIRMKDVNYNFVPDFILKYEFETYKYLRNVGCPVFIFHGDRDESIHYNNSLDMKDYLKPNDSLFILEGQKHNKIDKNPEYQEIFSRVTR